MKTEKGRQSSVFRGRLFLLLVVLAYLVLAWYNAPAAFHALRRGGLLLLRLLPVFAVVIGLIATVNYFLRPALIVRWLGRESGLRGWLLALLAGVISHGPMYAWYPMVRDLRSHGGRDGLVVVFLFARCIKVPLLPIMVDSFGLRFTLVLSGYILAGALVQGWLMERIQRN
ncbi:MAG TPA: permease [Desulfobulbus sp.]|nr:permease [Desulfobulbus sp.]